MVKTAFIVIDEDRSSYVHRVHKRQSFLNLALFQTRLNLRSNINKRASARHIEPKLFSVALHSVCLRLAIRFLEILAFKSKASTDLCPICFSLSLSRREVRSVSRRQ